MDKKRAYEIADIMIQKKIRIVWNYEAHINLVDRELLHHMKQAGCYAIAYGIESASPETLKTFSKTSIPSR